MPQVEVVELWMLYGLFRGHGDIVGSDDDHGSDEPKNDLEVSDGGLRPPLLENIEENNTTTVLTGSKHSH